MQNSWTIHGEEDCFSSLSVRSLGQFVPSIRSLATDAHNFAPIGTLQVSNVNMLDWAVGGFMIFVGVVAMGVGMATANQMRLVRFAVKDESTLKQKWEEHDANGDGSLDVKELTAFVNETGVTMTRNEIAAFYLAIGTSLMLFSQWVSLLYKNFRFTIPFIVPFFVDKNFDQRIAYEEFYAWWTRESDHSSTVV
jgi:hypothetical protein